MLNLSRFIPSFYHPNIAIDLGTANVLVYVSGHGVVLNEPSVIALLECNGSFIPYAFGHEAKLMLGRTPEGIRAIRPLKDGVIADFKAAEEMIKYFIKKIYKKSLFLLQPAIVVCVPYGSTPVERRAIQESVESAGAKEVYLIEEPMAAAIGAGLPVTDATGSLVVDVGGGTTEVGMISLGGIVCAHSIRVGGDCIDDTLISYIKKSVGLLIGEGMAERIKKEIGLLTNTADHLLTIRGRDIASGIPKEVRIPTQEIIKSILEPMQQIADAVKFVLESSPPELSGDIIEKGIMLTGGGAMLFGLAELLHKHTNLPVRIADDPLSCVVLGIGKTAEHIENFKHVLFRQS